MKPGSELSESDLSMATYKFNTLIGDDHTIELPAKVPTGRAEIHVITEQAPQGASSEP